MAEEQDKSSKTEEPTHKRLQKARDEGNFAKAEEMSWLSEVSFNCRHHGIFARCCASSVLGCWSTGWRLEEHEAKKAMVILVAAM